jgi:hypothetical protein
MKPLLTILCALACSVRWAAADQSDIDLGGKIVTFTNLQGHVYEGVKLEHATLDGVVYSVTNGIGGGMVKFKDLSTNFLADLNIPADRVQLAAQRAQADAERKQRYDAAVRALAIKQQHDQDLAASNAMAQATAEATAAAAAASNRNANATQPKPKTMVEHRKK